jgi:hypothetical protein
MDRYRVKAVPDSEPNADGKWYSLPDDINVGKTWADHVDATARYIPDDHHIVAIDRFCYIAGYVT